MTPSPTALALLLAASVLAGCTVCGTGTREVDRQCLPEAAEGDDTTTVEPDSGDAGSAPSRSVQALGRDWILVERHGRVVLPGVDAADVVVHTAWTPPAPPAADGTFRIELPTSGTGLVFVDDAAGDPVAAVLVPTHPLLGDPEVVVDPLAIAATEAWTDFVFRLPDPLYTAIGLDWVRSLSETQALADATGDALVTDPNFLQAPPQAWVEAGLTTLGAMQGSVRGWADANGGTEPFLGEEVAQRDFGDDSSLPGRFEPGDGADVDMMGVTVTEDDGLDLDLAFESAGGRWTSVWYADNRVGFVPPTRVEIPSPSGTLVDLASYLLIETAPGYQAWTGEVDDRTLTEAVGEILHDRFIPTGELNRWVRPGPGRTPLEVVGLGTRDDTLELSDQRVWAPAVLTALTEVTLPFVETVLGASLTDPSGAVDLGECISAIPNLDELFRVLMEHWQEMERAALDGDIPGLRRAQFEVIWAVVSEGALWECVGFDGMPASMLASSEKQMDRAWLGQYAVAVETVNVVTRVGTAVISCESAVATSRYELVSPLGCVNGLDDDGDGWTDAADPDCVGSTSTEAGRSTWPCNNGVDDDGDGAVDAADPECLRATVSESGAHGAVVVGDLEGASSGLTIGRGGAGDLTIADIDGDGVLDLATQAGGVWTGPLSGAHGEGTEHATNLPTPLLGDVDLDGDGLATDLVVRPQQGGVDYISGPLPSGAYDDSVLERLVDLEGSNGRSGQIRAVDMGDVDADGTDELVVSWSHYANSYSGTHAGHVSVVTVPGGAIQGSFEFGLREFQTTVAAADVTGDGLADISVGGSYQDVVHVFSSPPTGALDHDVYDHLIERGDADAPGFADRLVAADIDGDGLAELLVRSLDAVHVFDVDGIGLVASLDAASAVIELDMGVVRPLDSSYANIDAADLDGDGTADLVLGIHEAEVGYEDDGAALLFYGGGWSGTLTDADADAVLSGSAEQQLGRTVAIGDVSGDGWADLLVTSRGGTLGWLGGP